MRPGPVRRLRDRVGGTVLLLAGVTLNAFFSALILFLQFFADMTQTFHLTRPEKRTTSVVFASVE